MQDEEEDLIDQRQAKQRCQLYGRDFGRFLFVNGEKEGNAVKNHNDPRKDGVDDSTVKAGCFPSDSRGKDADDKEGGQKDHANNIKDFTQGDHSNRVNLQ